MADGQLGLLRMQRGPTGRGVMCVLLERTGACRSTRTFQFMLQSGFHSKCIGWPLENLK